MQTVEEIHLAFAWETRFPQFIFEVTLDVIVQTHFDVSQIS